MTIRLSTTQIECLRFINRFGSIKKPVIHRWTVPTYEVLWRRGYITFTGMTNPVTVTQKGKDYLA